MGRKSKLHNSKTVENLIQTLRAGVSIEVASQCIGVARSTMYGWIQRGEKARLRLEEGLEINDREEEYLELLEKVERAQAEREIQAVTTIKRAGARGSWRASAWLLERSFPERYGRKRAYRPLERVAENQDALMITPALLRSLEKKLNRVLAMREQTGGERHPIPLDPIVQNRI